MISRVGGIKAVLSPASKARRERHRRKTTGEFLRGPIPRPWLAKAIVLPGKAPLAVALVIWFVDGMNGGCEVVLSRTLLERWRLDRFAAGRGVVALESAGLIRVTRARGRAARVKLLKRGHRDA